MTIQEREEKIIKEFGYFEDWMDKYAYLIELGRSLPLISPALKTDGHLISGCQSQVWLAADYRDGKLYFTADSDATITKGIVSLLIRVLSDATPKEVLEASLDFVEKIGLSQHLSPTRANGLFSMIKQMKQYALAYASK